MSLYVVISACTVYRGVTAPQVAEMGGLLADVSHGQATGQAKKLRLTSSCCVFAGRSIGDSRDGVRRARLGLCAIGGQSHLRGGQKVPFWRQVTLCGFVTTARKKRDVLSLNIRPGAG